MKYIVITRSLQTDYQWEHDAQSIAGILLDLLLVNVPENIKSHYDSAFISYFSRYIADSSVRDDDDQQAIRKSLSYLMEQIEQTVLDTTHTKTTFSINYSNDDYDLLANLIETTIKQYYLYNKQYLIEKIEFLKQDYGQNLVFLNSSKFYTNLTRKFYNHGCDVFYSKYNNKDEIINEYISQHCSQKESFELVLV